MKGQYFFFGRFEFRESLPVQALVVDGIGILWEEATDSENN